MSDQPTKDPFTSPSESSNTGNQPLLGLVSTPVAAVGGLLDQVSRKVTTVGSGVGQILQDVVTDDDNKNDRNKRY